ncbi:MAG: response regulator transcription factor [Firmicutes bacterium]|nr:response regulator transcription factor [Bacillota bacterium]
MEIYALRNSGFEVMGFDEGTSFFEALESRMPRLVVLDIMLPGDDGLDILKKLKADDHTKNLPVIMVTAKTAEIDAVRGLDGGADDYVTKPFGIMEFISRVKAVLRRSLREEKEDLGFGKICMDDKKRMVTVSGKVCELTYKEYELLKYLMNNNGIVLSRELIMDKVWGTDFEGESRTLDMHIKTLRQKLGDAGSYIKTVRNVGYKFETDNS